MRIGPFEIIEEAGAGGMGTVWEGRHSPTDLPVAVKFLTHERADDPIYAAAFQAEARAVARLHHPRVVRIYDVGRLPQDWALPDPAPGTPYIVMEWAPRSLADLPRPLAWKTTRGAVLEVLDALAQVHARGIVHRDIKPSNVLGRPGRLRLADFGIARLRGGDQSTSASGSGTPYFMPPEQFTESAGAIGPASDLYSVGCLTYLLVTGAHPFEGDSWVELARLHFEEEIALDGFARDFVVWLRRMTAKRPDERYRFAAHAATDLLRIDDAFVSVEGAPTERWLSPKELAAETLPMTTLVLEPSNIPSTAPIWQEASRAPAGHRHLPYWRGTQGVRDHVEHLRGAGMRLTALREPPLLGRESERDRLWGALKEVVERRKPRIATIAGETGSGKSRLARWLGERGHELGGARWLVCDSDREQFLVEEIRAEFGGRDRDELGERIDATPTPLPVADRNAIVRLLTGTLELRSEDERRRVLLRALQQLAGDDALVLIIEDVDHGGPEAVEFAHFVRRQKGEVPILVVLTARSPLPDPRGRLTTVELSPLTDPDISRLVRDLVELHPDLAAEVVGAAGGNPGAAVGIVRRLVAEGRLRTGGHGYELKDPGAILPPTDDARVQALYDAILGDHGRQARDALEYAAALGRTIARAEWLLVTDEGGTAIPEDLETALESRGAIVTDAEGLRFATDEFRGYVIDAARERNEWRSRIAVCRSTIDEPGPLRAARWHFEAGAYSLALSAYLELADRGHRRCEGNHALRMLQRAAEAAAHLPAGDRARALAEVDVRKAILWAQDRLEDAEQLAAEVERRARDNEWTDILAEALERRARFARKRVELDLAEALYEEARELFAAMPDDNEEMLGTCLQGLGMCAVAKGDLVAAERYYEEALERFMGLRALRGAAWCANGLGDVFRKQDQLTVAESWYERALNWFETTGDAYGAMWCIHDLAQTRRAGGDLAGAVDAYEDTLRMARELGRRVVAPRLNLGVTRVEQGDYDAARVVFEEVVEESRARSVGGEEGIARLCLLPCDAAGGRWDDLERNFRDGRRLIGTLVDPDLGRMAAEAARLAESSGRHRLARELRSFAAEQG